MTVNGSRSCHNIILYRWILLVCVLYRWILHGCVLYRWILHGYVLYKWTFHKYVLNRWILHGCIFTGGNCMDVLYRWILHGYVAGGYTCLYVWIYPSLKTLVCAFCSGGYGRTSLHVGQLVVTRAWLICPLTFQRQCNPFSYGVRVKLPMDYL